MSSGHPSTYRGRGGRSASSPLTLCFTTTDTLLADTEGQAHENQHRIHTCPIPSFYLGSVCRWKGLRVGRQGTRGFISALSPESEAIRLIFLAFVLQMSPAAQWALKLIWSIFITLTTAVTAATISIYQKLPVSHTVLSAFCEVAQNY